MLSELNLYDEKMLGPINPRLINLASTSILSNKFGVPPFPVLNSKEGFWQNRKKRWIKLGIKGEIGRKKNLCGTQPWNKFDYREFYTGTSVFDPVTCELMYKWFCPAKGQIIDPFAGGSVRGIVASLLGFNYWGCDLSQEQINANIEQEQKILNTGSKTKTYNHEELTPIENIDGIYVKRDDLCSIHGARGGKARTCYYLAKKAKKRFDHRRKQAITSGQTCFYNGKSNEFAMHGACTNRRYFTRNNCRISCSWNRNKTT